VTATAVTYIDLYVSFMKPNHERKPMRLPGYDYSMPGAYFITACTKNRDFLFETQDTKLAVESAWYSVLDVFANVELDRIRKYIRNNPKDWFEDRDNLSGAKFGVPAKSVDDYWKEIFG
jgi:hypothetical protein